MRLTQVEIDRVLIFTVAEMARRRRARGLKLNYPEATALIADEMMERARGGADYQEVRALGGSVLAAGDVMDGVATLCRGLVVEPMFDDGPRIIVLANPIVGGPESSAPGEQILDDAPIDMNVGRDVVTLSVTNTSSHPINVSSHYHFYEVNPRMEFDRPRAYRRHLDIQAGRSVIWKPGETREVQLVAYGGSQTIDGFQLMPAPVEQE